MNLSKEQEKIVNAKEHYVVVNASAAAGKTQTLTERVRYLSHQNIDKDKIIVITFTNAAAEEMITRLGEDGNGIFIGTIHSYANYLLKANGYDTSYLLEKEQFDMLFEKVKTHSNCIKEVKYLLLDEAQDTGESEWEFILDLIKPQNFMLFGDIKQSIYRWKGAKPDYLFNLMNREDVTVYPLYKNYRNGFVILNFAKNIINKLGPKYTDNSISGVDKPGIVYETDFNLDNMYNIICDSINKGHLYNDWFILGRTNKEVDTILDFLQKKKIPCDSFKRADLSNQDLAKIMNSNTVKILTIHSAKGLENKYVYVVGQRYYNEEERCISYVAATRAKELLIWTKYPKKQKRKTQITNWE